MSQNYFIVLLLTLFVQTVLVRCSNPCEVNTQFFIAQFKKKEVYFKFKLKQTVRCMKDTTCQVKYPESCNLTSGQACESSMAMCVPILKLGECPVSSSLDTNMTQNECVDDQDCLDDYKCCPSQSKYNSCTSKIILMCEMSVLFNRMLPVFLLLLKNHA